MALKVAPSTIAVTQFSVPAHVREQYPELLKFLEYYFIWQSQSAANPAPITGSTGSYGAMDLLTNMVDYRDIDDTTPQFVDLIIKQFISFIPDSSTVNRSMIAARIKDFYKAKGTLPSYDFLLNLLTGQHAELSWNSPKVFRPSSNHSTRDATMFVTSNANWTTLAVGSFIEQYYPTEAFALVESVTSLVVNNKIVNQLDIDPESITGNFVVNGLVRCLNNTVDRSHVYADVYYTLLNYNAVTKDLTVSTFTEPSRTYPGLVVKQVGSNFRAVIQSLDTRIITNNQIEIIWTLGSVTGVLGTGDIYLVTSAAEAITFSKGDYQFGVVDPTVAGVQITNGGALYETGKDISYVGGTGTPFTAKINEVGGGPIDTINVTAPGYGYSVGDALVVNNEGSGGNGLSAVVSSIDGIGAQLGLTLELDNFQIANGGTNYSVGDVLYVTDGVYPIELMPTTFTVASINSTLALNSIVVNAGGYGYHYAKVALLDTTSNALVAGFAATASVANGSISAITVTQTPTITHSTLKVLVNGSGGQASATTSGGAVTAVNVVNGGFNYVNPVVIINSSTPPTRLATVTATVTNGVITGFAIQDGGAGYSASVTVTITEMTGAGFSGTAVTNNSTMGPVTGLTITNRGTYTQLPNCFGANFLYDALNAYYNPLVIQNGQTLTIPNGQILQIGGNQGTGLVVNMKYRIKSASVANPGSYYTYVGIDTTNGIGSGAIIQPVIQNGVVTGFSFSNHGTGYTQAQVTIVSASGGKGFQGICNLSAGTIASVTIVNGGYGYTAADTVVFSGNGVNAAATISVTNGTVTSMTVVNGGQNYAYDTALTYVMDPVANPSAVAGTFKVVIDAGMIDSVTVVNGGSGYIANLTNDLKNEDGTKLLTQDGGFLDFDSPYDEPLLVAGTPARIGLSMAPHGGLVTAQVVSGGSDYFDRSEFIPLEIYMNSTTGSGFIGLPVLENGKLVAIDILNSGTGFLGTDTASVLGGSGSGATITPIIYQGKVVDFIITNHGQNYRYGTSLLVVGDGAGADIDAIVNTSIQDVEILAGGQNYVDPIVTVSDVAATLVENPQLYKYDWQGTRLLYNTPRTNLFINSSQFNTSTWGNGNAWGGGGFIVNNDLTYTSPDGYKSVSRVVATAGGTGIQQQVSLTGGVTYTFSIWLLTTTNPVTLRYGLPGTQGNVLLTVNTSTNNYLTRYSASFTPSTSGNYVVGVADTVALQTFFVWGAQLEVGTSATPYISTQPTFTGRSSTASYFSGATLSYATPNVARYGTDIVYPFTQTGLILENAATNYGLSTNSLSVVYNKRGVCTMTDASGTAPDGTNTATLVQNLGTIYINDCWTLPNIGTTQTRYEPSIFMKTVSTSGFVQCYNPTGQPGAWLIDLSKVSTTAWQRITRLHPAVTVQNEFNTGTVTAGGIFFSSATGVALSFYIWGHQFETAQMSTSFIQNTSTTLPATRAADVFSSSSVTVTDWSQATDGSFALTPTPSGYESYSAIGVPSVYKSDWQGNQLQFAVPRTNLMTNSQVNAHFTAFGATPPTVTNSQTFGGQSCSKISFTSAMTPGYANCRADTSLNASSNLNVNTTYTDSIYIGLSRALTGTESIFVYFTGAQGIGGVTINAANCTPFVGTISRISLTTPITLGGIHYPVVYLNSALTSNLDVYATAAQTEAGTTASSFIVTGSTPVTVTDYVATNSGKITFAAAPANTVPLTWSGSYRDVITNQVFNVTNTLFGTGNGTQTVFQMLSVGSGSGAILIPYLTNGAISGIKIVSGGTHYRNPVLTITDSMGSGAALKAIVTRNIEGVIYNASGSGYVAGDVYISSDGDDAGFNLIFEETGSIFAPNLYVQGTGYTATPNFILTDTSNLGKVTGIKILSGGYQYQTPPSITLPNKYVQNVQTAGGASFIGYGSSVGAIKSVSVTTFGADWTEPPLFQFPLSTVMETNSNFIIGEKVVLDRYPYTAAPSATFFFKQEDNTYLLLDWKVAVLAQEDGISGIMTELGEYLDVEDSGNLELEFYEVVNAAGTLVPYYDAGPSATVFDIDFSRNVVELTNVTSSYILITEDGAEMRSEQDLTFVDQYSNGIYIGDTLIGATSKAESTINWFNRAAGVHNTKGIGITDKMMVDSVGVLDHTQSKIHDGNRIQDFAYAVRSRAPLFNYEDVVKSTVHPAGYKMYGDLISETVATGTHKVTVPLTFGIKGASSSFQTKLNEKSGFVDTSLLRYTSLSYYARTIQYWYTTAAGIFADYTFQQFDINNYALIKPLVAFEPWVARKWTLTGIATAGSDTFTGMTVPSTVVPPYRVIAYDSNGNNIFRENRIKLEDGTYLLNEDSVVGTPDYIDTVEDMVHVMTASSTTVEATKFSTVSGTVTVVVEDIPPLLTALNTYTTVASPLTINTGTILTINTGTILQIV